MRYSTRSLTVGSALDEWLSSRLNTVGPNTERDYRLAIEHQLKPFKLPPGIVRDSDFIGRDAEPGRCVRLAPPRHLGGPARRIDIGDYRVLGNLPISKLDDLLLNVVRQELLQERLSVKRINNLMTPLRGAIRRQVTLRHLDVDPFDLLMPLAKSVPCSPSRSRDNGSLDEPLPERDGGNFVAAEGDPDPLTIRELTAILPHLHTAMANQVLFACWTGLRTGELIALRWSDFQLDRDRFLVRRSVSRGIVTTTKTGKQRWVNLLPPARSALEAQRASIGTGAGWVFPNPFTGARWANDSKITRRWRSALRKAGVRYRRPYQMRHTYASMMLSAGENPLYVAQQMGHADWSMIVRVYGRWLPSAAACPAGSLVAAAHAADWPVLIGLLAAPK